MEEFLEVLHHAFLDTAKLLPFLVIVYFLIEFLEYKNVFRFEKSRLLTGKASPAIGAGFGIIPQCGFSVISAELFSQKKMSISALIAVFLATSDEAFPILISNYKSIPALLALLLTKFLISIIVGYLVFFIYEKLIKKNNVTAKTDIHDKREHSEENKHHEHEEEHEHSESHKDEHEEHEHSESHKGEHEEHEHKPLHACCHHNIGDQRKFNWKHPLIHSIKIAIYIFIVNFALTGIIELIGEDKLADFLKTGSAFQPLFALVIGFIPNCASSVILTELFMQGMISFGSIVTGLCANAGIGLFVLFKENKNVKENLFVILVMVISSLVFGYALHFIPFNFA